MEFILLLLTGFAGGLTAGMLGLGGGIFYILVLPTIINWFGIPPEEASPFVVANSIIGIAFASGVSIFTEYKKLFLYLREIAYIAIPSVIFSLSATYFIVYSAWFSREFFNIFVVILMVFILIKMIIQQRTKNTKPLTDNVLSAIQGFSTGSISGTISALSGLGGGVIIIPILQIKYHQSTKKSKILSLAIIFISTVFISLQNLISIPTYDLSEIDHIGFIIPEMAIPLIIGVVFGGPIGVKLSSLMSDNILNKLFSIFVLMVLIEKLFNLFF